MATDVYKTTVRDYVVGARDLFFGMSMDGFLSNTPIPIDPSGELLGGAHRLACALALGIEEVPVEQHTQRAWAPPWDAAWFRSNGLDEDTIAALEASLAKPNTGATA